MVILMHIPSAQNLHSNSSNRAIYINCTHLKRRGPPLFLAPAEL